MAELLDHNPKGHAERQAGSDDACAMTGMPFQVCGVDASLYPSSARAHRREQFPPEATLPAIGKQMNSDSSVLITGGTGSFGRAFVATVLARYPEIRRLVVFSRDELKQFEMSQRWSEAEFPGLRYFLGDVRDQSRLVRAMDGIDTVIHAAALKQVVAAEYNPFEFVQTNVIGANNVVSACLQTGVRNVVALSTDKAAAPVNLYGATKLCSDKIFIAANNIRGARDVRFSVVRYGNVMGSRGSLVPFFLKRRATGILPITDPEMTRFNISLAEGVEMVLWALDHSLGAEIFVPKIPSFRVVDAARAIGPECKYPVVGIRPGEKVHEEMITLSDSNSTVDLGQYYAILPGAGEALVAYCQRREARPVPKGFAYSSGTNPVFLTVDEFRELVRAHVSGTVDD